MIKFFNFIFLTSLFIGSNCLSYDSVEVDEFNSRLQSPLSPPGYATEMVFLTRDNILVIIDAKNIFDKKTGYCSNILYEGYFLNLNFSDSNFYSIELKNTNLYYLESNSIPIEIFGQKAQNLMVRKWIKTIENNYHDRVMSLSIAGAEKEYFSENIDKYFHFKNNELAIFNFLKNLYKKEFVSKFKVGEFPTVGVALEIENKKSFYQKTKDRFSKVKNNAFSQLDSENINSLCEEIFN